MPAARSAAILATLAVLFWSVAGASSEDRIAAAMRDAQAWVDCTRAFDAACVAAYTDPEYLRGVGTTPELFARSQALFDAHLKELHAIVSRFDLHPPREEFRLDAREVVFIPYEQSLDAGPSHAQSSAFLIGLSRDGASWRFIDGAALTLADIRLVLPSYVGEPPLPETYSSASSDGEASPYSQIFSGLNGPRTAGSRSFFSADEARHSWVAEALGNRIDELLARVDFKSQILIAAAIGERMNANGSLSLSRLDVNASRVQAYVAVGINESGCGEPALVSYPFVLAVLNRPKGASAAGGVEQQAYPNGCGRTASGEPHGQ